MTTTLAVTLSDVEAASHRLKGVTLFTPMFESAALNERSRGRVLIKAETLQHTGSFKLRGAFNCMSQLDPAERRRGVVAFSSGNHAQGVAWSARLLNAEATVFMPQDAPGFKIRQTRLYGATVVLYDRFSEDREALAASFVARTGAVFVNPYDDPHVIAGQGTIGLEALQQAQGLGVSVDVALVPCGGGGLCAGGARR